MTEQTLEQKVLAELLRLRKLSTGVTVEALSRTVTICDLLGAGDPFVAYTRLTHEVLDSDLDLSVRAAATSLGLLSAEDTHLKRLDALGDEIGLEARQVRRYSDRGIRTLARLIASNWPTETVPQLSVSLVHVAGGWEIHLTTVRLMVVEMRTPTVSFVVGETKASPDHSWSSVDDGRWERAHTRMPLFFAEQREQLSAVVIWRGELWPKYNVTWVNAHRDVASESLGNKLVLRLSASPAVKPRLDEDP